MPELSSTETERSVRAFDFQRHEALDRSRLRRLSPILEVAAHRVSQSLTGTVRTAARVEIGELEQQRWEDYANSLPEPTFLVSATVVPVGGRVTLHLPLPLAMGIVELRLGGELSGYAPVRSLTDIEQRLVGEVAHNVLAEIFQALSVVVSMSVGPMTTASSAVFVPTPNQPEICLLVALKIAVDESAEFQATISLPLSVLLTQLDALERLDAAESVNEADSLAEEVRQRLLDTELEVSAAFPEIALSPDEILSLAVGDVIPLHRGEGVPLHLTADGVAFCDVVPTTQGKRLACLVVESSNPEDR